MVRTTTRAKDTRHKPRRLAHSNPKVRAHTGGREADRLTHIRPPVHKSNQSVRGQRENLHAATGVTKNRKARVHKTRAPPR